VPASTPALHTDQQAAEVSGKGFRYEGFLQLKILHTYDISQNTIKY
jgi:hypothetical protein